VSSVFSALAQTGPSHLAQALSIFHALAVLVQNCEEILKVSYMNTLKILYAVSCAMSGHFFFSGAKLVLLPALFQTSLAQYHSYERGKQERSNIVPNIVHWISPGPDGELMAFWQYLNALSIVDVIKPDIFYFHHTAGALPSGAWWNKTKCLLTLVPHPEVTRVFHHDVLHIAHKSDVLRLKVLYQYGGIYLDTDVLVVRSFESLRGNQFTIGIEAEGLTANAVMIAMRNAPFVDVFYKAYEAHYDENSWAGASVKLPHTLALQHPDKVVWLPKTAFFSPTWTETKQIFSDPMTDDQFSSVPSRFAQHLWHHVSSEHLNSVSCPAYFRSNISTLYSRLIKSLAANAGSLMDIALSSDECN
jgi:hypothetical protein